MPDRLADLVASATLNGIDFVEIANPSQTALRIHFLNAVAVAGTLTGQRPVTITGGEAIPSVEVRPIAAADFGVDDVGRPTLLLRVAAPGDFSNYLLAIASPVLDPQYAAVRFTFKAGCPSTLDCAPPGVCGPLDDAPAPLFDYLAKDYASFRAALLDYSASAYPHWVERDEPDVGMMLVELFSAVGDDLSYLQDRVTLETALGTATQQVSAVRLARLVDYEPGPATSAQVLVQVDVAYPAVPRGVVVEAALPDGGRLSFELGGTLLDPGTGNLETAPLDVDPRWNRLDRSVDPPVAKLAPYWWDDSLECLPRGATELWIRGHGHALPVGDPDEGTLGLAVLIDTAAPTAADPPSREIVHLTRADEETDPLYGIALTHLAWDRTEALRTEHALSRTALAGNLVPAVEGLRHVERFVVDPDPDGPDAALAAVTRRGADAGTGGDGCGDPTPRHLHTLRAGRLAWLGSTSGALPELVLAEVPESEGDLPRTWRWRRSLLDAAEFEPAFTVDPVAFRDVRHTAGALPWFEYDGDDGDSVRFGDGWFGAMPSPGASFDAIYRTTSGAAGNVAADAVAIVPAALGGAVLACTNPFPASGGADRETIEHVRANAPHAFRSRMLRAVRAEDYTAAAHELSWVLDAGTRIRWTGSWAAVFTTTQPPTGEPPTLAEASELGALLDRRRMAGYEAHSPDPRYVGLDLVLTVCALPGAIAGEVEAAVHEQLGTGRLCDGSPAFFAPGNLRFGAPLERSELEAAVQRAHGVDGVVAVRYRRRGHVRSYRPMPEVVPVGADEILRVDDDPTRPDRGSLRVVVKGGA